MPDKHAWEGRSRGSTLGYRIFVGLLKAGGVKPAYSLLHFVTLYYRFFVPQAIKPLRYLYSVRMGFDKATTARLIKQNLLIFGQTLIDKIVMLSGVPNKFTFEDDGVDNISQLLREGKGGFLISAHLGNWELAGHCLEKIDGTINILMYDGEAQQIKDYMEQFDNKRSFKLILIKEDMSHVYEISAALARNELICLHADRFRPGNRTMKHLFMGEEASFPQGPFVLGAKLKAPVCFVFAFKEGNFHYHFSARRAGNYEGRGTTGVEAMLSDYVAIIEEKLKQYPAQWFNYYDFWKA